MSWRAVLLNRFVAAALALALIVAAINVYVALNDDGLLAGRVVDQDGRPLEGAEVVLLKPALVGLEEIDRQTTDAQGRFAFHGHGQHHPALQVRAEGHADAPLRRVRLYFRNQNRVLDEPISMEAKQ